MTADGGADTFGPYAFTLAPAEAEAAAARAGLRMALKSGLLVSHVAPLAAFVLIMAFASILGLTGLISRRAAEMTLILAAAAFMIQRLMSHWRIRGARREGRAAIEPLQSAGALKATFDNDTLSLEAGGRTIRLTYDDCEAAEDAGGLIYVWPRHGAPIIVPTRALADADEKARLVSRLSGRIGDARRLTLAGRESTLLR
jgi:hypothetical protein